MAVLAISVLTVALSACEKPAGPAEKAGQAIDNAVQNTGRQIEKAGEKIQDTAQDAKK